MALYSIDRAERVIREYIPDSRYQEVLIQKLCQNKSLEEIGETTGFSTSWVKEIINRYRDELLTIIFNP